MIPKGRRKPKGSGSHLQPLGSGQRAMHANKQAVARMQVEINELSALPQRTVGQQRKLDCLVKAKIRVIRDRELIRE
tara:strand:- start:3279 stop:3509 length:231 start_codon:yes stop_codon:yes gene_type:complete